MLADEQERLRALVEGVGPSLLRYLVRRASDVHEAADMLGEVHLVLARKAGRIPEDPDDARMWAFGIARLVVQQGHRRRGRDAARLRPLEAALHRPVECADPDDARLVRSAVRALPSKQRELIALVYWDGWSIEDASRLLGIAASTARTHLQRARARLSAQLGQRAGELRVDA